MMARYGRANTLLRLLILLGMNAMFMFAGMVAHWVVLQWALWENAFCGTSSGKPGPAKFKIFCSVVYIFMKGRIGDRHSFTGWFGAQI